jgi:leucine dehydrogenase
VQVVDSEAIYDADVEVFAPCALGAVVSDETLLRLKTRIVAGAANNQLATPDHGIALGERGILYAPDYVINAGGIIHVAAEITGEGKPAVERRVRAIGETLLTVFNAADAEGIPTNEIADRMARSRISVSQRASAA